ncbi:MAG TPA: thioredoxin domain-containing protein [Ilumatobacter sp.]|nr:thioredoxin domain-containing protein [Ilumatobacter sp.]
MTRSKPRPPAPSGRPSAKSASRQQFSKNVKVSLGLIVIAVVVLTGLFVLGGGTASAPPGERADMLVRPDSQRLQVADDGKVTFVEFLDFECEACRAAYPGIEELRSMYEGRVTFVVRNFPLHRNSVAAASAAEAAAAQGRFEEMYQRLFETQAEWGEQEASQEDVFFGFAEEIGLDMDEFRAVYDDPATAALIERDQADGKALGVTGTPTFFLNGDKVQVNSFQELIDLVDAALAA